MYSTPVLCLPGVLSFPKPVVFLVVVQGFQNKHLFAVRDAGARCRNVNREYSEHHIPNDKTQPMSGSITLPLTLDQGI